jgi:hypothetical protein
MEAGAWGLEVGGGGVTEHVREGAVNYELASSQAHVDFRFCKNTLCYNRAVVQPFCSST